MEIGKLEEVSLREVWRREEQDFSVWLEENLELLGESLSLSISPLEREKAVGPFHVDLLAEDDRGELVVIENQLTDTDHDHLGKLLTYLTGLDAKTAIWITPRPRPQHTRVIEWLNEVTPEDMAFYLVRVTAYRIGGSPPAPLFTVLAGPSAEAKAVGEGKKEMAERHRIRRDFWQQLLERAKARGVHTHAGRSPSNDSWLSAGAGKSGFGFNYLVWLQDQVGVELEIRTPDEGRTKQFFEGLYQQKDDIERAFGGELLWERLDNRKGSRIRYLIKCAGIRDREKWPEMQDQMIDAMDRFSKALTPRIAKLGD